MIKLTKLGGGEIYLNPDLIEAVEETPDTHLTLTNGNRFLVLESAEVIVDKIVALKARIIHRAGAGRRKKYLKRTQAQNYRPLCKLPLPERE